MHTYWKLNKYLSIPSEFVIILYYLYNNYSALIGVHSHQLFLDYPLEDINIMSKNNHQTFVSLAGDSRDDNNKFIPSFETNDVLGREPFV